MSTLASYDAIPYDSIPITDTHVDTLAATARLFGVNAPDSQQARVLELGCAEGGNLIPMAFYLPEARFIGIDLSQRQVAIGQQLIASAGLANIELLHRDVALGAADLGEFDYIIAHGLYSWAPPAVQQAILDLCARQLAPNGIAYISFNTLPGWRMRGMVRDLLLHHTRAASTAKARLALAYQCIETHAPAFAAVDNVEARFIAEELRYLRAAPPSYLYHEYLEDVNEPLLFADFMQRAQGAGLQYVADSALHTMLPATLGETARAALGEIDDRIAREQHMDFLRGRRFRRTLLTRAAASVRNTPDMEALHRMALYADLASNEEIDLGSSQAQAFTLATGEAFQVRHPLAKAAAMLLAGDYPNAIGFSDLFDRAAEAVARYGDPRTASDWSAFQLEMFSLLAWQAVRLTTHAEPRMPALPEQPRAHVLARAQLAAGAETLASVRHTAIHLDEAAAALMHLLDGTRNLSGLVAAMTHHGGTDTVTATCDLLRTFTRNGLLQ